MATNFKISLHCRSKSEPFAPNPFTLQLEENLQRFKSSEASSSSSSIVCQNLIGLQDLHNSINEALQLPNTQQALARGCRETLVDELLSVRLLDFSGAAKEALLESKETIKDLQSSIRRRRGGEVVVPMEKFLSWRTKVKKATRKTLENLKGNKKDIALTSSDEECDESVPMIRILKETELITLSHLQSLLSFICGSVGRSKHSKWSIVFKLMWPKRVACDYERANTSEFENLDTTLESLLRHKHCSVVSIESFQSHLENLELALRDLEEGIDNLQRGLIRIRVSLLNIFNH
ncbi:uncharacterized protein LOC129286068 [Prosopis cineraria]|uniref:uncharacterized protein LOC129286068 n=1 Tax=Prosopis cineraria TaxID=364024 RepID=UPI0024105AA9|nr:uncharacterized protein LOC129286068 [Prosopis cineraria]